MSMTLQKGTGVIWATLLAVFMAVVSSPSSYGQPAGIIYYGGVTNQIDGDGTEFGVINPETWELEPIDVIAEPDGSVPGPIDQPESTAIDTFLSTNRGLWSAAMHRRFHLRRSRLSMIQVDGE